MSEHPTPASVDAVDERTSVLPVVDAPEAGERAGARELAADPPETVDPSTAHRTAPAARADDGSRPLVTIVLPCFNEQEHVLAEVDRICAAMDASDLTYELLAIDDASTDDTLPLLLGARAQYPAMRVMPFRRNGGSGTARRSARRTPAATSSCGPTRT
jgi:polyisoprenyl-phosphate glycosyltransferase